MWNSDTLLDSKYLSLERFKRFNQSALAECSVHSIFHSETQHLASTLPKRQDIIPRAHSSAPRATPSFHSNIRAD